MATHDPARVHTHAVQFYGDDAELFVTVGTFPSEGLVAGQPAIVIAPTLRGRERTPVRAYGEMVDTLWKQGKTEAAVRLEVLWNNLADSHAFSLLCGYSIGDFYKHNDKYQEICNLHSHVYPHAGAVA